MKINKEWHEKNRMPKSPTPQLRIDSHVVHAANCSCRPIPEKLRAEIDRFESDKTS
jgi:hypothetical protein